MSIEIQIKQVQTATSSEELISAVRMLAAQCDPLSITTLVEVLGYNNPGAAVAAVDGLVRLGEVAVMPILKLLDGYNYGARAWAIRALAEIGDNRAIDLLLDSAENDFSLSVRRSATRGLGNLSWHQFTNQEIATVQKSVLNLLIKVSQESEWVVRYAAIMSLESLALNDRPEIFQAILQFLETRLVLEQDNTVWARIQFAIDKISSKPEPKNY
jgi:phycocyanobilin lyase beta subunit